MSEPGPFVMRYNRVQETAVYLGKGNWKVLAEREAVSGQFDHLPQRRRPWRDCASEAVQTWAGSC